jgi:hypothetical protein
VQWVDGALAGDAGTARDAAATDGAPPRESGALDGKSAPKESSATGSDHSQTPPPPPPAGLGQLCTSAAGCPAGELCLFMEPNATKGICLRQCATPNQPCAVPDQKFFSPCMPYTSSQLPSPVTICAVACQFQGKQYPCPNAVDYKCKSYGFIGICIPK